MAFSDLLLSDPLLRTVHDLGFTEPTEIQAAAIPSVLMGKDLIGVAQTGTGKTASFVLPMIDVLSEGRTRARMPRSLILEPTRELASQVADDFTAFGRNHKLEMALLIGGVAFGEQDKALARGVDVLIATPGRLLDQHERGKVLLSGVDMLVIDEADRMLDMGFIPDIEKICSLLKPVHQTLLFSATMPPPIKKLADRFMSGPQLIEVARPASTNENIDQRLISVEPRRKRAMLRQILREAGDYTAIVFANRKTTVRDLLKSLQRDGFRAGQIHGDMDQPDRLRELERFRNGEVNILVASDVAARGLDIKGVSHVINFDTPWHPDDYVHRVGRTGRAGATGIAYTFMTSEDEEAVRNIEKLTGMRIPRVGGDEKAAAKAGEKRGKRDDRKRNDAKRDGAGKGEAAKTDTKTTGAKAADPKEAAVRESKAADTKQDDRPQHEARKPAAAERKPAPHRKDEGDGDRRRGRDAGRDAGRDTDDEVAFGEFSPPDFLMVSATGDEKPATRAKTTGAKTTGTKATRAKTASAKTAAGTRKRAPAAPKTAAGTAPDDNKDSGKDNNNEGKADGV